MDGANLPATSEGIIAARQDRRWLIHSSFFRICDAGLGAVTDCSSISPHPISNHRLKNPKSHCDLGNPVPFFNWLQSRSPLPSNRAIHKVPNSPQRRQVRQVEERANSILEPHWMERRNIYWLRTFFLAKSGMPSRDSLGRASRACLSDVVRSGYIYHLSSIACSNSTLQLQVHVVVKKSNSTVTYQGMNAA